MRIAEIWYGAVQWELVGNVRLKLYGARSVPEWSIENRTVGRAKQDISKIREYLRDKGVE